MPADPHRRFGYVATDEQLPPDYSRTARALTDAELEDEILGGKGEPGYRLALLEEADRRAQTPPVEVQHHAARFDADEWETEQGGTR